MKKIMMMLASLNVINFATLNLIACSADDGNKIEISYSDPSANTSESKDTISKQIIFPLLQTLNISQIKFSNGVKWTQAQVNNSLWSQKELLNSNAKSNLWEEFYKKYLTTEDHSFNKVEVPWKLENTGSLSSGKKRERKIAVLSELNPIIDALNEDKPDNKDYVRTSAEYQKANNYAIVKLKNSPYIVTVIYKKEFKFNLELKNLTASLARIQYKDNNDDKWEWFFAGYQFKKHDIFPINKDYVVTKNPDLYRPTLSEINFPFADLEFNIIGDSIEKIN